MKPSARGFYLRLRNHTADTPEARVARSPNYHCRLNATHSLLNACWMSKKGLKRLPRTLSYNVKLTTLWSYSGVAHWIRNWNFVTALTAASTFGSFWRISLSIIFQGMEEGWWGYRSPILVVFFPGLSIMNIV